MFSSAAKKAQASSYINGDIFNGELDSFVYDHMPSFPIDEISFFHLSRRLNNCIDDYNGNNLMDLLTTVNPLSQFLKEHQVQFQRENNHLVLIHRGKIKPLNETYDSDVLYLRGRLGYNVNREDFCFNGFAFKDLLYKNDYARQLYFAPEFIGILSQYLHSPSICNDYLEQSSYYCYEYLIPMDKIIFDDFQTTSQSRKSVYLINRVLNRLSDYDSYHIDYIYDHDNPIIRLGDFDTMDEKHFISKELISQNMIFC